MTDNRESWIPLLVAAIFVLVFLALVVWWTVAQWNECRAMGLSVFYCMKHVL